MKNKTPLSPSVRSGQKKLGRPIKLDDPTTRNRVIELIAKGVPQSHACAAVGVTVATFIAYRTNNEWFREELATAVAVGVEKRLKKIEAASEAGDWKASAWLLERTQPDHFAKSRIEVTGADGGPLAAGIAIYLPKKNGAPEPAIDVSSAKQIENESD